MEPTGAFGGGLGFEGELGLDERRLGFGGEVLGDGFEVEALYRFGYGLLGRCIRSGNLLILSVPGFALRRVFGVPDVVFASGDLFERAMSDDGVRFGVGNGGIGRRTFTHPSCSFDQEPVWFAFGCGLGRPCG